MADSSLPSTERVNPAALPLEDAARALGLTLEIVRADIATGAPTNADGTMNLVHYAPLTAWLRRLAYLGATVRASCFTPRVDLTRNMEVGRWLAEDRTRFLLMVDSAWCP